MYRFRPSYEIRSYPIDAYPAKTAQGRAMMLMIMNNLDRRVAQFPHELITYGGNGSVFQNWAQYHVTMQYLSALVESQTLTMYSGHPMGLYPSHPGAPKVVISNGMVIPNYCTREQCVPLCATCHVLIRTYSQLRSHVRHGRDAVRTNDRGQLVL